MNVGTPTHWKRYFVTYLTKSGAPDIVPFKKKNIFYGRPKTKRDERNMFIHGSGHIHREGVVVFNCMFQLDTPKDLLLICLTIASTIFYLPEIERTAFVIFS